MTNQLRKGIETLKLFYINKLKQSKYYNPSDMELRSLTLSELEELYKKISPPKEYG
jgi:hypothetical protein